MNLLSDQISEKEVQAISRELAALLARQPNGDVVEFGCYLGTTSVYISKLLMSEGDKREYYVYDSFAGLPEKSTSDSSPLGLQFKKGELLATKKQFIKNLTQARVKLPHIKKAWFDELTATDVPKTIAFAFLDGDYYDSIKISLKLIETNLTKPAVIIVHDYGNGALPGAAKATDEWLKNRQYKLKREQSLAIIHID